MNDLPFPFSETAPFETGPACRTIRPKPSEHARPRAGLCMRRLRPAPLLAKSQIVYSAPVVVAPSTSTSPHKKNVSGSVIRNPTRSVKNNLNRADYNAPISFRMALVLRTASALFSKASFSSAVRATSITFSAPFFPITVGTPMQMSFCPNSPSR